MNEPARSDVGFTISTNKTDQTMLNKFVEWVNEAEGSLPEVNWRTVSKEDYDFYAGKQDTDETLTKLDSQKRPATVYNTILPKINMLCGLAAQSNRVPYLFPVTTEDDAMTEVMNGAFKHFRTKAKIKRKENDCFAHTVKSGRSYLYFYIGGDNPFKPSIMAKRIPGRDVLVDPLSTEYDMSDARYVMIDRWFVEEDLKAMWPELDLSGIRSLSASSNSMPSYYDTVQDKYRLTEIWYRKWEKVIWFRNPITGRPESASPEEFKKFVAALKEGVPAGENGEMIQYDKPIQSIPRVRRQVYYAIFSNTTILEEGPSPYTRLQPEADIPIVQYGAYKDEDENRWFSVITMMKDPQRGRNAMRRQLTHLLNTAPKGLLVHEVGALINEEEYNERSSEPNFRLVVGMGKMDKYKFTDQPTISPIYEKLDMMCEQDMKDTSGVQDPLMGIQTSSREPGITARLRQEQNIAVLYILFENFRDSRIQGGKILLGLIQQYCTEEQLIRIEGQQGAQLIAINQQSNPQAPMNDISVGEYDMVVDEAVDNVTMRMAIAQMMVELNQTAPNSIPPALIMEYADLPLSARIKIEQYNAAMMEREERMLEMQLEAKKEAQAIKGGGDMIKAEISAKAKKEQGQKQKGKSK